MLPLFERYARWVQAWPKTCLFLAFLLCLLFAFLGRDVRLNNHFAVLFSIDNDANQYRHFYRQQFGADDAVLVALLQPQQADAAFFQAVQSINDSLESHPHFVRVYTPVNTSVIWSDEDTIYVDPLFGGEDELPLAEKLALMRQSPATAGRLIAGQSDTFTVMAQMPVNHDRYQRIREPAEDFRQIVDAALAGQSVSVHYAGIAFTRIAILKLMLQDLVMLVPLTSLVVMLFSLYLFRRWLTVWLSVLTSLFGVATTIGVMGLNHDDINQLTLTFPILLMVIIVANNVHFYHRFFRERQQGNSVVDAVRITTVRIGMATLLSCFTTMIGFYALMTADMMILRSFGFYLGTGVLMSFIGMMLIIPPCLLLFPPQPPAPVQRPGQDWLDNMVAWVISDRWRLPVCSLGLLLLLAASWAASQAKYDYFLSDMLTPDHPQTLAGKLMDAELSGSLPLEISLLGQPGDFKQAEHLQQMQQLSEWLQQQTGIENWLSLAAVIRSLNKAIDGGDMIPAQPGAVEQLMLLAEGSSDGILQQLVNDDYSHARIKSHIPDMGADALMQLQTGFQHYAAQLMQGSGIQVRMTGEIPVAYEGMNQLTKELIASVLAALLMVLVAIYWVFRDIRLTLASVFPNILPIVTGLAAYALSGHSLNPLPGIAFCIGIGIAVDDTVHLFSRFNEELAKGKSRQQAIRDAMHEIKGALIATSVILTAGFLVFLLSAFTWNRELGMLGAILIVLALLADLIFTPAILAFQRKPRDE